MGIVLTHDDLFPVHGPDFISSPVLFPRNQTGDYDTAVLTCHCGRSDSAAADCAGAGDVEAHSAAGNMASECRCGGAILGRRVKGGIGWGGVG